MINRLLPFCLTLLCVTGLLGCRGPSYVNIPADAGDVAFHTPNGRTVRAVVVKAVDAIVEQTPLEGPVALSLPEGTEALTYESIANEAGGNIIPAAPDDPGAETTAALAITEVRVRGHRAEVDAIRARVGGSEQLVTAYLSWSAFDGWGVDRIRAWRIPVEPNTPR